MMGKGSKFDAGAAFNESLEKRIEGYERKAEKAKRRWYSANAGSKIAGSTDFVEIPDFKLQRKFDADTGKVSYEIAGGTKRIPTPHLNGIKRLKRRAYYEASGYVHKKIAENEEDNEGLKAAHKLEQAGEEGIADLKRALPSGRTLLRKAQRNLERQSQKAREDYNRSLFQKEMAEDALKKSGNAFSKEIAEAGGNKAGKASVDYIMKDSGMVLTKDAGMAGVKKATKKAAEETAKETARQAQKRIRRYAAMQAEAAKKTGETVALVKGAEGTAVAGTTAAGAAAGGTAVNTAGLASGVEEYVLIAIAAIIVIICLIIAIIVIVLMIMSFMFFQNNIAGAMYQSEPQEIEAAELHYSYMEACLDAYIEEIEDNQPGYDGYVYDSVDAIGHNPFTLINYISAHYGDFVFNDVKDEIEDLFNTSYTLTTWVEDIEVSPPEDTDDEEDDEDEDEEDDEEPETIILHVLHIKLERKPLEEIVNDRLTDEDRELYDLYLETHGGLQYIGSPTGGDFSSRISSYYGYRYHPIHEEVRLHRGLDIALPEGTDLYAGINGTVTTGDDPGGYGLYIIITGDDGTEVRYAHMSAFDVTNGETVQRGEIIGKSGNTGASTGPHVHVEVKQNGEYYNPLFYVDTE